LREVENVRDGGQQWIEEGLQELRAITYRLQRDQQQLKRIEGRRVYWATSLVNRYRFLKGGARQKAVQYWAKEVRRLEKSMQITVEPLWVGPSQGGAFVIQREGRASTDEWAVRDEWLQTVLDHFKVQPTVDALATAENMKCARFFSISPQSGSAGVDFFAQQLEPNEVYLCCPPVKLAAHCIWKIVASQNTTLYFWCRTGPARSTGLCYKLVRCTYEKSGSGTPGNPDAGTHLRWSRCSEGKQECRCGRV
jgi:hypothetical protein